MKKTSILAAALLVSTAAVVYAQKSPGASEYTPGDTMKDRSTTMSRQTSPGASASTPGHLQKSPGGASEFSPGDTMNDKRSPRGK